MEDVSKYPDLFAELVRRGWNDDDLEKLAGGNLVRVFREIEQVFSDIDVLFTILMFRLFQFYPITRKENASNCYYS